MILNSSEGISSLFDAAWKAASAKNFAGQLCSRDSATERIAIDISGERLAEHGNRILAESLFKFAQPQIPGNSALISRLDP